MSFEVKFCPDTVNEINVIQKHNLRYKVDKDFDISDIDIEASKENWSRLEQPIDEDHIRNLAESMKAGEQIPYLVVVKLLNGKYLILSGLHRTLAALSLKVKKLSVYIINTQDEAMIKFLPALFNKHGKRVSSEETIHLAVRMVEEEGKTERYASEWFGVSKSSVGLRVRANKIRRELTDLGMNPPLSLPDTVYEHIGKGAADNTHVLHALGSLVIDTGLNGDYLSKLTTEIRGIKTEAEKMARIVEERSTIKIIQNGDERKVKNAINSKAKEFIKSLTATYRILEKRGTFGKNEISNRQKQREICENLVEPTIGRLGTLLASYRKIEGAGKAERRKKI